MPPPPNYLQEFSLYYSDAPPLPFLPVPSEVFFEILSNIQN